MKLFILGVIYISVSVALCGKPDHVSGRVYSLSESSFWMWLSLNHYKRTMLGFQSDINDASFFVSQNGSTDPQGEYNQFVEILQRPETLSYKETISRFPARSYFVLTELGMTNRLREIGLISNTENELNRREVSLIYASLSFKGLSSALGHAFLKSFDPENPDSIGSKAIYFSANSNGQQGVGLIVKGLTGGYSGRVSAASYITYIKDYLDKENRDLYEYRISIKRKNLRLFDLHIHELSNLSIEYRFVDSNCVSQLVPLINILLNEDFFKVRTIYFESPSDVLIMLEKEGFIKKHRITRSRYTLLCDVYRQMNSAEQKHLLRQIENENVDWSAVNVSDREKQFYVVYKSYQLENMAITDSQYIASVEKVGKLKQDAAEGFEEHNTPTPKFKLISSFNIGYATDLKRSFYQIGVRPVSVQTIDSVGLLPIGCNFNLFNTQLRFNCEDLGASINRFDFVDVVNIPRSCALVERNTWMFYIGGDKRIDQFGRDSFLWRVNWKYGKSEQFFDDFIAYAVVSLNVATDKNRLDYTDFESGVDLGCSINKQKYLNSRLNCEIGRGAITGYNFVRGNATFQRDIADAVAVGMQFSWVYYFDRGLSGNDLSLYVKRFF